MKASYKLEVRKSFNLRNKAAIKGTTTVDEDEEEQVKTSSLSLSQTGATLSPIKRMTSPPPPPRLLADLKLNVRKNQSAANSSSWILAPQGTQSQSQVVAASQQDCDSKDILARNASSFDLNRPLTDQAIKILSFKQTTFDGARELVELQQANETSRIDLQCGHHHHHHRRRRRNDQSELFKLAKIEAAGLATPSTAKVRGFSCVAEYLDHIGASCVPLDAFGHVVFQYKYLKSSQSSSVASQHQHQLPLNCKESFVKFEYIHGDRKYWIVKVRKVYDNLFQLKFYRTLSEQHTSSSTCPPGDNLKAKKKILGKKQPLKKNFKQLPAALKSCEESFSSLACSSSSVFDTHETKSSAKGHSLFFSTSSSFSNNSDVINQRLRPLGWSKKHGFVQQRPAPSKFTLEKPTATECPLMSELAAADEKTFASHFGQEAASHAHQQQQQHPPTAHQIFQFYKENIFCELQDERDPQLVNIMYIKRNVGGRLLLEYLQDKAAAVPEPEDDQSQPLWISHLNLRVHPLGWAKTNDCKYDPVEVKCLLARDKHLSLKSFFEAADSATEEPETGGVSAKPTGSKKGIHKALMNVEHETYRRHDFRLGYLMECLFESRFYVAKVVRVLNEFYFEIEIDTPPGDKSFQMTMHKNSLNQMRDNSCHTLFPCKWCEQKNLVLTAPKCWPVNEKPFDWDEYTALLNKQSDGDGNGNGGVTYEQITDTSLFEWSPGLKQLSDKFQLGMYLECVDPRRSRSAGEICLAQVKAKTEHLIFVRIISDHEVSASLSKDLGARRIIEDQQLFIFPVDSHDIFPVNWCDVNDLSDSEGKSLYNIRFPITSRTSSVGNHQDDSFIRTDSLNIPILAKFNYRYHWCQAVYLNSELNCGPLLSKSKLSLLPRTIGPGPIALVLGELVKFLVSATEKPQQILRLLPSNSRRQTSGFNKNYQKLLIRLKDKAIKNSMKEIWVCTQASQLPGFLEELCHNLKCCPKLISLQAESNNSVPSQIELTCRQVKCCLCCSISYDQSSLEEWNQLVNKSLLKRQYLSRRNLNVTKTTSDDKPPPPPSAFSESSGLKRKNADQRADFFKKVKLSRHMSLMDRNKKGLKRQFSSNSNSLESSRFFDFHSKRSMRTSQTSSGSTESSSSVVSDEDNAAATIKNLPELINLNHLAYRFAASNELCPGSPILSTQLAKVSSNPLKWSIERLCDYLAKNELEAHIIQAIKEQSIDGQSFLLLNLPTIKDHMNLKLGPALKLANLVENLKLAYIRNFNDA